ncbi:MAG: hypothetical protein IKV35_00275 [Clostridia bacterium]|nr:hypothetical protein [Clostridia bacterium]
MKLQSMGTAAAEAMPALFCRCDACVRSRAAGGKNIRMRSGLIINDTVMIDFCPDAYALSLKFGIELAAVRDVFITHSHHDHFDCEDLVMRRMPVFCQLPYKLNLFGNAATIKRLDDYVRDHDIPYDDYLNVTQLEFFKPYETVDGVTMTYLPAQHAPKETAGIYLIRDGEKTALYAHDTGEFLEETMAFLKTQKLDFISLDACYGKRDHGVGHMGIPNGRKMVAELRAAGAVNDDAVVIVNHFSHNCGQLHEELEAEVKDDGFLVAYDGMIVNI